MRTALVCIACKEDNYINEWISWHKAIGFDNVFVYQNNWRMDISQENVTCIPFDGQCMQLPAYNDFLLNYSKDFDFAAFLDVDEFIFPKKHETIKDLLKEYDMFPGLALNWKLFGSSGIQEANGFYSCINRFTHSQAGVNNHVKTILNLAEIRKNKLENAVKFVNPHFVNLATVSNFTISPERTYVHGPWNNVGSDLIAYIAHYVTKSVEECKERRSRVRSDTATPREEGWLKFFLNHDMNQVENLDLLIKTSTLWAINKF